MAVTNSSSPGRIIKKALEEENRTIIVLKLFAVLMAWQKPAKPKKSARTNRETSTPQTQSKHLAAAATSDGTIERYKARLVAKGYTLKALTSTSLPFR